MKKRFKDKTINEILKDFKYYFVENNNISFEELKNKPLKEVIISLYNIANNYNINITNFKLKNEKLKNKIINKDLELNIIIKQKDDYQTQVVNLLKMLLKKEEELTTLNLKNKELEIAYNTLYEEKIKIEFQHKKTNFFRRTQSLKLERNLSICPINEENEYVEMNNH